MTPEEKFYAHLDLCEQCREHPFDLCEAGARLIVAAGRSISPTGRLVSNEPVFQNLPVRTELGRELKESFARVFGTDIKLDLSKLEQRLEYDLSKLELDPKFGVYGPKDVSCPACEAGIPKKPKGR